MCRKAGMQLNAASILSRYLDNQSRTIIYNTFIMSNFSYSNTLRYFCSPLNTIRMEKINQRELCMFFDGYTSPYEDLLVNIGRPMLNVLRLRAICIGMFQDLNNLSPAFISKVLSRDNTDYELRESNRMINQRYAHNYAVRTPFAIGHLIDGMSFREGLRKLHQLHISNLWWRIGTALLVVVSHAFFVNS